MKKLRTLYYCVIQPDGAFCFWSIEKNPKASWRAFLRGLGHANWEDEAVKEKYVKEGCRCVPVRLTLAEKGKGK